MPLQYSVEWVSKEQRGFSVQVVFSTLFEWELFWRYGTDFYGNHQWYWPRWSIFGFKRTYFHGWPCIYNSLSASYVPESSAGCWKKREEVGMAQCNGDMSRDECGKCLDSQLVYFRTTIGNKRWWETYGSGCFMWYHDYQFYFNFTTASEGELCHYKNFAKPIYLSTNSCGGLC